MRKVIIRRCPVCLSIRKHTGQLVSELRDDTDTSVDVVDGNKGEFMVEANGRKINGKMGDVLRNSTELASEIRGAQRAKVG